MNSKSLYIHIPFCISKCDYCDFFSISKQGCISDSYITALKNEISWYCSYYNIDSFRTIYIGGGTPSLLSATQLQSLLLFLNPKMNDCKEFTIEMNPETVTEEKLSVAKDFGITRLSVGIQSFNENALKAVHRHYSVFDIKKALDYIKRQWDGSLNLDVIAGLPSQNSIEFISSLQKVLEYEPDHISMYALTVEDGTPFAKRIENGELWVSDIADEQWLLGKDKLHAYGFKQYEVSNFCKAGKESLHNMTYWQQQDYIGCGSGATGSIYAFGKDECGLRWTNANDIEKYVKFWTNHDISSVMKTCELPRSEEILPVSVEEEEFFIMGLRTVLGVSSREYKKRFFHLAPYYGDIQVRMNPIRSKVEAHDAKNGDVFYSVSSSSFNFLNSILINLL
ncbi:MAG: radical SAM family heme chaperone HemW [Treponema sp.]|nr:radical SAM family heme chaperone HemW [Treponema sp.]